MKYWILLFIVFCASLSAETYEEEVNRSIESIRTIKDSDDKKEIEEFNSLMDANWKKFSEKKSVSIPIIQTKLKEEQIDLITKTFETIDFRNPTIVQNTQQYFRLALFLSEKQIPGFLNLIDQRFLQNESRSFFIPQHIAMVDAHAQRTHLYGIYGNQSVPHLINLLKIEKDTKLRQSITSILRRICTPDCANDIYEMLETEQDHTTFVNGTYILLDNSGPIGRELYLKLKPKSLSKETDDYFFSEKTYVKNQSYPFFIGKIKKKYGESSNNFSDSKLLAEIDKMIQNQGATQTIHPLDFFSNSIEKQILIDKLIEARRKCFLRINRHGMEDIDINNFILNTIYYKDQITNDTI
ncbi:hypothetical protein EHQ68_16770 [Leptospira congkakensis]|uniref:Uncharacterized protein n=1 Tax=Leptospira congkakensis TaxID=2484932 RepID=A0A4Z1AN98_9LEPT|nr:hypothetical protein [Leptospira congkakensis]TGL85467.1 hypothetical protein EHQ68_16770 [Leptospira congkakensis]TGL92225.1 hypothetical protein EHQ69_08060 [Leptospira congkakensis]TGL99970.1 hypothetical protein EHQ70_00015 [Leptospira congkakensis]